MVVIASLAGVTLGLIAGPLAPTTQRRWADFGMLRREPLAFSETLPRQEPGSLAASVTHSVAVVLGVHRHGDDGSCTRPGCDDPCAIADFAEEWQKLATDLRELLEAKSWLGFWILQHVNADGDGS